MKVKINRSATAIPCLVVFTKPLTIMGLPKNLFIGIAIITGMVILLFKNLLFIAVVIPIYFIFKFINKKDETRLEGFLKSNKKKYISY